MIDFKNAYLCIFILIYIYAYHYFVVKPKYPQKFCGFKTVNIFSSTTIAFNIIMYKIIYQPRKHGYHTFTIKTVNSLKLS